MNVRTFIDRPILSGVISVLMVLVGIIGLSRLALEQFPEIAPPTVRIMASYTGANAETVQKSVVVPLEEAINGVEGMMYMTSSASNNGTASIGIFFRQGTDPNMAMVNVQNRAATVQGRLPSDVVKSGLTVRKRQTSNIKQMAVYSPDSTFDRAFLANYTKINIEPRLSRIPGVGEVNVMGADYSMRIWLDPLKMAQYGLTPADITQVLNEQNVEVATGTLGAESDNTFQYVLKYRGRYEEEQEYANLVIRSLPDGDVLRIGDIARVELGSQNYNIIAETNGCPGVNISINQVAGSNANEIIKQIDAEVEEIRHSLPPGIVIEDLESKKDFLDASIASVVETLLEALLLVILVVWLFLGSWRSTIIPAIAIVVSLIATLAVIYAIGFSLNMLTLFALVLVIGTVVDDAIVVVEAVQTRLERGEGSLVKGDGRIESSSELSSLHPSPVTNHQMTEEAMKNITSALITTTLVFMAVFVPVCFISGVTGTFYTQFGLTMAIAVAISLFNALTLSPALSAIIMRDSKLNRFQAAFNRVFVAFSAKYKGAVGRFTHYKKVAALLVVLALVALGWMMKTTRTGLVPNEDMGTVFINVQASPGSSLQQTYGILKEVEARIKDLPQLRIYSLVAGNSNSFEQSSSNGNFTLKLKKWDERTGKGDDDQSIVQEIYRRTADIANAKIQVNTQNMLPGFGRINGFELHVQDKHGGTIQELYDYTNKLIAALNERPEISRAFTNFSLKYPQYRVEVDAALCKRRGVSPSDVLQALSGYVGGSYASNFVRFTKLYRVMVQASPEYRLDAESLNNIFVRTSSGEMSPIGQYLTLTRVYGSETLSRFNLFPSIQVGGTAAEGYSSGQAIDAIRKTAAEVLPEGYGYEFGGMTREEASSQNTTALVFVLCIIFIYLILCALYESLFIPMAVILSVPFGLAGSFLFANLWGLENNIYMQTGLIMLIGLLSKTAILLTEYATTRRRQGLGIVEAALDAAAVRLRPILMTSMTMVFGLLPLALATGVGANGNHSLGVGTIGGMVIGTIALLFIVPVLFVVFQTIEEKVKQIFKPKN
ncbi:efflux RND transporter permease subunit [uncultured Prevotella sp.]|uniref:efflux RND transporter permease subunit n=1 Tax=uncultured Prevotella sp. TaxID=159272 RepID=UPI0025DD4785|nr:efflux RND transporter permease subunit [uncultured Prevotella sp.]